MNETEKIIKQILDDFIKKDSSKRKHASFFEFFGKTSVKETGVFEEFLNELELLYQTKIYSWGTNKNDPPDIEAKLKNGKVIGIEITELVNEKAIVAQINKPETYTNECMTYGITEAVEQLNKIVLKKEIKTKKAINSFDELILLIHTDETMFTSDNFKAKSNKLLCDKSNVFSHIYLMFSYEPAKQKCPILKLQ